MGTIIDEFAAENEIKKWIAEVSRSVDFSHVCISNPNSEANIVMNSQGICVGFSFVTILYNLLKCEVEWLVKEGTAITSAATVVGKVTGPCHQILRGEPIARHILSRASGVASSARNLMNTLRDHGWTGTLATPSCCHLQLGMLERFALAYTGVMTDDQTCSSVVLLSENHMKSSGLNLVQLITETREACGPSMKLKVCCRSLDDVKNAVDSAVDIVFVENVSPKDVKEWSTLAKNKRSSISFEVSLTDQFAHQFNCKEFGLKTVDVIATSLLFETSKGANVTVQVQSPSETGNGTIAPTSVASKPDAPASISLVKTTVTTPQPTNTTPSTSAVKRPVPTSSTPAATGSNTAANSKDDIKRPRIETPANGAQSSKPTPLVSLATKPGLLKAPARNIARKSAPAANVSGSQGYMKSGRDNDLRKINPLPIRHSGGMMTSSQNFPRGRVLLPSHSQSPMSSFSGSVSGGFSTGNYSRSNNFSGGQMFNPHLSPAAAAALIGSNVTMRRLQQFRHS